MKSLHAISLPNSIYLIKIGALFLLSSCYISMPEEQKREHILPPPSLNESVEMNLQTPFFTHGDWPKGNWWEDFQSPELNELIVGALKNNPTLQETYARLQQAKQTTIVARASLFPWLSFEAEDNLSYLSKNGLYRAFNPLLPLNANLTDLFISLQYDCDFWGKNRQLFQASVGEKLAAQAEVAQIRLLLTTAIVRAFIALKTDLVRQELVKALVNIQTDVLQLQLSLKTKALASKLPILTQEELLFEAKQMVSVIEEKIALDKHMLNVLIGRGPDEPLCIDGPFPYLPKALVIPCNLSLNLVARRPDLMAQIWRAEALSHEVGAAIADFYPDIRFTLNGGVESVKFSNLLSRSSSTYTFFPAIHLPIFTAGSIKANVGRKKAAFDEAVFAYNQLLISSAQEVADALVNINAIYQRREAQQAIIKSVKTREHIITVKKKSGLNNLLDLYRVQLELIFTQFKDLDLLYEQYTAAVQLIKALGGGYESEDIPNDFKPTQQNDERL